MQLNRDQDFLDLQFYIFCLLTHTIYRYIHTHECVAGADMIFAFAGSKQRCMCTHALNSLAVARFTSPLFSKFRVLGLAVEFEGCGDAEVLDRLCVLVFRGAVV